MININIEVRPEVKPIVFDSRTHLNEEEKKELREFFEKNLLAALRNEAKRK